MSDLQQDYSELLTRSLAQGGTVNEPNDSGNRSATVGTAADVRSTEGTNQPNVPAYNGNGPYHQPASPTIGKLVEALAKAQAEFKPILKEAENSAFMRGGKASKYATLDAVIDATRPALSKYGLVVFQLPRMDFDSKRLTVVTRLAHSSGEWIESDLTLPAADQTRGFTAHTVGSALTYNRRYSWQAITGCVAEEDDDGNEAAGQGSTANAKAVAAKKEAGVVLAFFYEWSDETQTATIDGPEILKTDPEIRKVLLPLWDKKQGRIIANGEQLESLKYEFEQRKIQFRRLGKK